MDIESTKDRQGNTIKIGTQVNVPCVVKAVRSFAAGERIVVETLEPIAPSLAKMTMQLSPNQVEAVRDQTDAT